MTKLSPCWYLGFRVVSVKISKFCVIRDLERLILLLELLLFLTARGLPLGAWGGGGQRVCGLLYN